MIDQSPVPTPGAFPASVKDPLLHCVMSVPAAAVVGGASLVKITSSALLQLPLVIVQRKVALVPAACTSRATGAAMPVAAVIPSQTAPTSTSSAKPPTSSTIECFSQTLVGMAIATSAATSPIATNMSWRWK